MCDLQFLKRGSPSHKHRRHAGLIPLARTMNRMQKQKAERRERHRLDGMFDSVEEMMRHYLDRGSACCGNRLAKAGI